MILFNINYWFAHSEVVTIIAIQHYWFISTQSNGSKYSYVLQTIQLDISHLFTHIWMIKQFYF